MNNIDDWEAIYLKGKQIMKWPSSDLISLVIRNIDIIFSSESNERAKVLELGFGTGPNFTFIESLKVDFYGIELSPTAVSLALNRFPELSGKLFEGSFVNLDLFPKKLDLIYDRAAVTHASQADINKTIQSVYDHLKPGGVYIGVEWFSKKHSDFSLPSSIIDANTRNGFSIGQFQRVGPVHFADKEDLLNIFSKFEILELTEKLISSQYPEEESHKLATWNIVVRKPL